MMLGQSQTQVSNGDLPPGVFGNLETVKVMSRVAHARKSHPVVRELALHIINGAGIPSHSYLEEARAIAEYVQEKVRYVRDIQGMEQLHDPLTMIEQLKRGVANGDCDDMSLLVATLLLSLGHKPLFRMVRYKSETGPYQHIYVVVYEKNGGGPRQRLVLDAIIKKNPIGFEVPHISGKEVRA